MNRRDFLRRASLVAAGAVAADQLDLIERLGWKRRLFPGWTPRGFPNLSMRDVVQLVDQHGRILGEAPVIDGVARFPVILGDAWTSRYKTHFVYARQA